ncbi:MAG: NFACT RNA binding domain-containing protein [Eubacteriales bacterium]|nr:NFACT RNA binding domain-containing protein [Eubacteriales bacterium]
MPLDGFTISFLCKETEGLLKGSRVDKIYQMDNYSLILNLRNEGKNHKLFISGHPQMGRFCLTNSKYENPETPPMFCMVLRKYLEGGKLQDIRQIGMERIVHFVFETINELGDRVNKVLVGEFMGKHSNIVLVDEQEKIIHDSLQRFPLSENSFREIMPGKKYYNPPAQNKLLMSEINLPVIKEQFIENFLEHTAEKAVLSMVSGISPVFAREICSKSGINGDTSVEFLGDIDYQRLENTIINLNNLRETNQSHPVLVKDGERFVDFTPLEYEVYQEFENISYDNMNTLVEDFVGGRDRLNKVQQKKDHLKKVIDKEVLKLEKRFDLNQKKIKDFEDGEKYRIMGDLLTANLYQIKQGKEALVQNYYSPEQEEIIIKMEENLTPNQNAQKYYKKYNKAKSGADYAKIQMDLISEEMSYLDSILTSIDSAQDLKTLDEIQKEMVEEDYLKKDLKEKKGKKKDKEVVLDKSEFMGFDIYVGHNNKQNDYLTMKFASSSDLWFHVKDIPGSHVLVRNPNREEIPEEVIEKAALLAARNSKGKNATIVPVDYTMKKHVKKPKGSKPGFVTYENAKTIQIRL